MHPANHGVKHKLVRKDGHVACDSSNNHIVGYLTFDTVNIVHFNAYGNDRRKARLKLYSPLAIRYKAESSFDPTKTVMLNGIVYKTDRFILVY